MEKKLRGVPKDPPPLDRIGLNDVINTFIILRNVKYPENCLDNIHGFLAQQV